MNSDGQIYFDDEALIPEEDKARFNEAHVMAYAMAISVERDRALRDLLAKANGRDTIGGFDAEAR